MRSFDSTLVVSLMYGGGGGDCSLAICLTGVLLQNHAGSDGAFVGYNENQYAILDEDGVGLVLYFIEEDVNLMSSGGGTTSEHPETNGNHDTNGALDEKEFSEPAAPVSITKPVENGGQRGPVQFAFDTPVQRIFSSPLGAFPLCIMPIGSVFVMKLQNTHL